ncbi:hypothetical protein ACFL09_03725 [Planctomycetota bacterium]
MSHATKSTPRRCRATRELAIHRRGRAATHVLHVEVRCEALPSEQEEKLATLAALERLGQIRRKVSVLKRLREREVADRLEPLC